VIGEKKKEEKLFYYLRPEELIPEDHILRLIDQHIDFSFIRPKVQHLYSHTGRPSVDPEVMMRMLLVGYLFGMTSLALYPTLNSRRVSVSSILAERDSQNGVALIDISIKIDHFGNFPEKEIF